MPLIGKVRASSAETFGDGSSEFGVENGELLESDGIGLVFCLQLTENSIPLLESGNARVRLNNSSCDVIGKDGRKTVNEEANIPDKLIM